MTRWLVELVGEQADLERLAASFNHSDCTVTIGADGCRLKSVRFGILDDPDVVRGDAAKLVEAMNLIARTRLLGFARPSTGP